MKCKGDTLSTVFLTIFLFYTTEGNLGGSIKENYPDLANSRMMEAKSGGVTEEALEEVPAVTSDDAFLQSFKEDIVRQTQLEVASTLESLISTNGRP